MRKIVIAALLCSTCLAAPASGAPLTAFIGGFLNALGAGTFLATGAVGAWGAGFAVGGFFGATALGRAVLSLGLSALVQAATRPKVPTPSERMVNYAQAISYQERGYGRVRKGGPFALSVRKGTKRHYGVIIAAHRTKGPVAYWLDQREVSIDVSGNVTTAPIAGYGNLRPYLGLPGQVADPVWDAAISEVTSAHNFAGLSYLAATATKPKESLYSTVMPSGREWVLNPVWDMDDFVYDPRDATRKWTANLALVIAREAEYFGRSVSWDEVAEQANICDQVVTNGDGGSQNRWTFNGVFDASMSWETVRAQLMLAGDVFFYERSDGSVGFKVGAYTVPTVTLSRADFLSLQVIEGTISADTAGEFATRYVEPSRGYIETPCGAVVVDASRRRDEVQAFGISSHNQAWRVAYRMAKSARPKYAVSAQLKLIGYELLGHRFVRITHAELGWDFIAEIGRLRLNDDLISFALEAVSVEPGDYAPNALLLEPARPVYVEVISDGDVAAPASLAGVVIDGTGGIPMIEWTWPPQDEALMQQIGLRRVDAGSGELQILATGESQDSLIVQGLADGGVYEGQVRNRSSSGRLSAWAPAIPITITALADTAPPGALIAFAVIASGGNGEASFTAPNSANYAATRLFRATGSTSFGDASVIRTEYGAANTADTYTDPALAIGSHSYWAEAINGSGIAGARSGPITITIV